MSNNKKLINSNYIKDINNKEMTDNEKQKVEISNNVSNKEALKDKIHEIHNYLRNNGAGYGMNALKVFNLLYGLKKIEEKNLLDKVKLKRPQCEFSYLLNMANEGKYNEKLSELIFGDVLTSIKRSDIGDLLFYEIPQNIKSSVFSYLIKEINKITIIEKTCNVLLSGKIYEYFIGRDESAISELGAYFTDRHIVDYIYKKLDPEINKDGMIDSMIDMFGGSGGFTTGYINYLNNKYNNINWKDNINNIYHYDMNEDVVKSAGLEFFCLTGILPNLNNLSYKNSFTDNFNDQKFMNVVTNPPYGGDKVKQSDAMIKRKKIKEYIKNDLHTLKDELKIKMRVNQVKKLEDQEKQDKKDSNKTKVSVETCSQRIIKYAKDNKLTGNDKESSSLILLMDMLDINGTCIGVLKEGVFFNKTYKDLRKCLITNFNVREVISVPQDQFENTSTKTSIVIFDNTEEKTSNIKFSDLIVEKYEKDKFEEINGEIVLIESKGDIQNISDKQSSSASKEELLKNDICSLNGKDYNKKVIICGNDYELKKVGDICESQNGYAFKTEDYKKKGVPLITITHIKNEKIQFNNNNFIEENSKYDKYKLEKNDIVISLTGKKPKLCSIAINNSDNKLYLNQRCALLRNFIGINNYYFVSIFNGFLLNYINETVGNGSNQENVSLTDILNIKIPIPKSTKKIKSWVDKISNPYDKMNDSKLKIETLETNIKNKIIDIAENEECDELNFDEVLQYARKKNKYRAADGKNIGKYRFYTSSQDKILYRDDYEFEDEHILIGRGGVASLHLSSKFSVSHDDVYVLTTNKQEYSLKYIYNYIKINIKLIEDSFKGSTIKHSSKTALSNIIIKIPKNKKLISKLEPLFGEIEILRVENKKAEELYKQYIQELSEEAIPSKQQNVEELQKNIIMTKKIKIKTKKNKQIMQSLDI
jgi:type I restriction enzyme S subunit